MATLQTVVHPHGSNGVPQPIYFVPCTPCSTPVSAVAGSPTPPSIYSASTLSASPVTPAGVTRHYYPPHPTTPQPIFHDARYLSRPISAQGMAAHPTPPMSGNLYYQMMWGIQYVLSTMIQSRLHRRLLRSRPHPAPAENFDQNASVSGLGQNAI